MVRRQCIYALAVEIHRAAGRLIHTIQDIGQRGFAGAVGTDKADQFRPTHLERHPIEGLKPAKILFDVVDVEFHHLYPSTAACRLATVSSAMPARVNHWIIG